MKTRSLIIVFLFSALALQAQQTATLYFLENTPMRHIVNPAFQPVSEGYLHLTPLGYTSLNAGNNSLTLSDLVFNQNGKTITAFHPEADRDALLRAIKPSMLTQADMSLSLLSFGSRVNEKGYYTVSLTERIDAGISLPHAMFDFLLGGGMTNLEGSNVYDLTALGMEITAYTELGVGYSHRINEHWSVGGKLKFLIGTVYAGMQFKNMKLFASQDAWKLQGEGALRLAAPIHWERLPEQLTPETIEQINPDDLLPSLATKEDILDLLNPAGLGGAVDLGITFSPFKQLEVTAAVTDLGFMVWRRGLNCDAQALSVFTGAGSFDYNHYVVDGAFSTDSLMSDVTANLEHLLDGMSFGADKGNYLRMPTARFNVGVMGHFFNHKMNVGVVSNTRLFNGRAYEEVTLGGSVTPCNWFNLAVSYSLVDNCRYSNIGGAISIMPYDGINLTLAMDYIPTSYAALPSDSDKPLYVIPYKTSNVNLSMGLSFVWGTNPPREKVKAKKEKAEPNNQ